MIFVVQHLLLRHEPVPHPKFVILREAALIQEQHQSWL